MSASTRLQLPYLAAGQAQKHITVNESLRVLDALVQLAAISATVSTQPASPADGDVYILPPGKSGADWGPMANGTLAYYRDGAWEALAPREGFLAFVIDSGVLHVYVAGAWAPASTHGWQPYAFPLGGGDLALTNTLTLPANGGALACPIAIDAPMLLQSLVLRSTDVSLARSAEWRLYAQRFNSGDASQNILDEIDGANGALSFTAGAASNQSSTPASAPVYLAPGIYWLVLRNTHASNAFGLGVAATGTMALTSGKTKTLSSALGASLDFVAASWSAATGVAGLCLRGRVFGEASAY